MTKPRIFFLSSKDIHAHPGAVTKALDDAMKKPKGKLKGSVILADRPALREVTIYVARHPQKLPVDLVTEGEPPPAQKAMLDSIFDRVITSYGDSFKRVTSEEFAAILSDGEPQNLFVGVKVDEEVAAVILLRGSLETIAIPFESFRPSADGTKPDFKSAELTDFGQTVRLGKYEASAHSILYEVDAAYRRDFKKKRLKEEKTFGASLRRLRLLRGLTREDFGEVSAKEIERIEHGKVKKPRGKTLLVIGKKLKVKAEEIADY